MYRLILLTFAVAYCFTSSSPLYSQFNIEWSRLYHSGSSVSIDEGAHSMSIDEDRNVYVTGIVGNNTYKVLKYSTSGSLVWDVNPIAGTPEKIFRINNYSFVSGTSGIIRLDANGQYYLISDKYVLDASAGDDYYLYATYRKPYRYLVTTKLSLEGQTVWSRDEEYPYGIPNVYQIFPGINNLIKVFGIYISMYGTSGIGLTYDTSGNHINGPNLRRVIEQGISDRFTGCNFLLASDNSSFFLYKASPTNIILDSISYFGNGGNWPFKIVSDNAGSIYLAGRNWGAFGDRDFVIMKLSTDCELIWEYRYSGTVGGYDAAMDIMIGPDGNIYSSGITTLESGDTVVRTVKLSPFGQLLWADNFSAETPNGQSDINFVTQLLIDDLNNIYLCGKARNMLTMKTDFLVLKYSSPNKIASVNLADYKIEKFQNYPNPFNPEVNFKIELSESSPSKVCVFDSRGRKLTELLNGKLSQGDHYLKWNANPFPSGVYFFTFETQNIRIVKKGILLK